MDENQTEYKLNCVRSNKGGEFTWNEFDDYWEEYGIRRKFIIENTP